MEVFQDEFGCLLSNMQLGKKERWGQIHLSIVLSIKDNCMPSLKFLYLSELAKNND